MDYRGYLIKKEYQHYVVIAPNGKSWREDTIDDAYDAIDEELDNSHPY